jgi:hypothetical protein
LMSPTVAAVQHGSPRQFAWGIAWGAGRMTEDGNAGPRLATWKAFCRSDLASPEAVAA